MMHTSEQHAREEAITLLEEQQVPTYVVEGLSQSRRKQALRTLVGVVSTVALVAGSVVAVEMVADKSASESPSVHTITMNIRGSDAMAPATLESQFGWGSINNGWCSIRANTWCLFSSDKEKCKKDIHDSCDSKPEEPAKPAEPAPTSRDGSGSGSGSHAGSRSDSGRGPFSTPFPNAGDSTEASTTAPTAAPTEAQTEAPTEAPIEALTEAPTETPTEPPMGAPTEAPTEAPTQAPDEFLNDI